MATYTSGLLVGSPLSATDVLLVGSFLACPQSAATPATTAKTVGQLWPRGNW